MRSKNNWDTYDKFDRIMRFMNDIISSSQRGLLLRERFIELIMYRKMLRPRSEIFRHLAVGFDYVKRPTLRQVCEDPNILFIPHWASSVTIQKLDNIYPCAIGLVWSVSDENISNLPIWKNRQIIRYEDGFLRSKGQGLLGIPARSWVRDKRGLHFNGIQESDLEYALSNTEFKSRGDDLAKAKYAIELFCAYGASKYGTETSSRQLVEREAILVLGQVEDDASIKINPDGVRTNHDLLLAVLRDYPDKPVYYRSHPDVALGKRPRRSNPEELIPSEYIISAREPISALYSSVSRVCTISSLGGFEALLYGAQVTTYGRPFYAGWGLTADSLSFPRRNRNLTVSEIFLVAYLDYPLYFQSSGKPATYFETLDAIAKHNPDNSMT